MRILFLQVKAECCISEGQKRSSNTGSLTKPYVSDGTMDISRFGGFSECKYSDPWMQGIYGANGHQIRCYSNVALTCIDDLICNCGICLMFFSGVIGLWVYDKTESFPRVVGCYLGWPMVFFWVDLWWSNELPGFAEPEHKNSRAIPLRWWWCSCLDSCDCDDQIPWVNPEACRLQI